MNLVKGWAKWVLTITCFASYSVSYAEEFSSAKYEVYKGDTNSDGYADIYLKRKADIIIIASQPIIPIAVQKDESFLLTGDASGFYSAPVLNNSIDVANLTLQNAGVSFEDFNNDGIADITIQGLVAGDQSVLLTGTSSGNTPAVLQQFSDISGQGVSLAEATITMEDVDGDGYADFVVVWANGDTSNLINLGTGAFAFAGPNGAPAPQVAVEPPADTESDEVGVIAGSFRVDESGAATYSIPIMTAVGIAGVAPQVSLNYSSQGGNGIVGRGWNIGGLSAIGRCRKTLETDGVNGQVNLDADDRFCLDGQRLMVVSGTYGAPNSEYRTEIDSFAKIVAYGGTTGNPNYFVVQRKDGSSTEYGNSSDSALEAGDSGKIISWAQNRFEDSVSANTSADNPIIYTYDQPYNPTTKVREHRIQSIEYAKADAEISFHYQDRDDDSFSYQNGYRFESNKRLQRIESKNDNGKLLREYKLEYAYGTHSRQSQLTSIEECNGSVCYPATSFDWSNPAVAGVYKGVTNNHRGFGGGRPADLDGDGINEMLFLEIDVDDNDNDVDFYVRIMRWNAATETYVEGLLNVPGGRLKVHDDNANSWWVIDYNNDGKQDLLYANSGHWKIRLGTYFGQADLSANVIDLGPLPPDVTLATVADYDSDGMPDLLWSEQGTFSPVTKLRRLVRDPNGTATYPYHFQSEEVLNLNFCGGVSLLCGLYMHTGTAKSSPTVVDFNGDGIVDLFQRATFEIGIGGEGGVSEVPQGRWVVLVSNSGGMSHSAIHEYYSNQTDDRKVSEHFKFGDLNADGLTDIVYKAASGDTWFFELNTGDGFTAPTSIGTYASWQSAHMNLMDYNGDGSADLFYVVGAYWYVREWTGNGFDTGIGKLTQIKARPNASSDIDEWATSWVDANGDGKLDAFLGDRDEHSNHISKVYSYVRQDSGVAAGVITEITNGFGAETNVTYKALTDPAQADLYTKGTGANQMLYGNDSPVFDLNAPIYVVQNIESTAPAAGPLPGSVDQNAKSSIRYEYGAMRMQSGGRGSLGYESVSSIDEQTNIRTTTTYSQEFPYSGRPLTTEIRTSGGSLLSEASNFWEDSTPTGPIRRPVLVTAIEKSYPTKTENVTSGEFSVGGTEISTVTTTTTINAQDAIYGDVTQIVVQTAADGHTYTKTTDNTYLVANTSRWFLGRLTGSTVTHNRTDNTQSQVLRNSSFTYDAITGLLLTEAIEPNAVQELTLTSTYAHDSYGNVIEARQNGYRGPQLPGESEPTVVDRIGKTFFDVDKRYPNYTENHYGQKSPTASSRNKYGAVTLAVDANGNNLRTAYGALGRQYWSGDDLGGFAQTTQQLCQSVFCPTGAYFRVQATTAGGGESMTYHDVLGREIRAAARMFDGQWSITLKEYDKLGRVKHASEPFASANPHTGTTTYWTTIVYDDLGRPTQTQHPDNSVSSAVYDGFDTTYKDQLSHTRTEEKNGLGELVKTVDHLNGFVNYSYDEQGNLAKSSQGGPGITTNIESTMSYDLLGRKKSMSDADMGDWFYAYNAFGELIRQVTGDSDKTEMAYDRLGRMIQRIDYVETAECDYDPNGSNTACSFIPQGDAMWIYDTAINGTGQLHIEDSQWGVTTPLRRTYAYDQHGRSKSLTTEITRGANTETYEQRSTYDQFGRVFQEFDGAQTFSGLEYTYNSYGFVERVDEAAISGASQKTYYTVNTMDARGNVTSMTKGGMSVVHTFDAATGRSTDFDATDGLGQTVQNLEFVWDLAGNLEEKRDRSAKASGGTKNILETYEYDELNRLLDVYQDSTNTLDMAYDALGNITHKHAFTSTGWTDGNANVSGTYGYLTGTHKVVTAGSASYVYNANGSITAGDGRTIGWSAFNKPTMMTKGGRSVNIYYGPNRNRYKRIDDLNQSGETTTHYVGAIEKIWRPGNIVETKRYLGGELIVTQTDTAGSIVEVEHYLLKDHLGSTVLITDDLGSVVQGMSFDAFGSRRSEIDFASLSTSSIASFDTSITTRGFTGHEGLDPVGLVHTNGRVYDSKLGRFISADTIVQAPANTQSLNRYSYVINNPLSLNDPTGHIWGTIVSYVVRAVISYAAGRAASNSGNSWIQGVTQVVGCAYGGFSGCVQTAQWSTYGATGDVSASLKAGAIAGVSYGAFSYIGGLQNISFPARVGLHGLTGGTLSVLQGGKFGHGFVSAGLTKLLNVNRLVGVDKGFDGLRIAVAAVVGGTVSRLTGGRFANGALTAAMGQMLNGNKQAQAARRGEEGPGLLTRTMELRHEALRERVLADAENGDIAISLSADELDFLLQYEIAQANSLTPAPYLSERYRSHFLGADSFIFNDGLGGRQFNVEGHGIVLGGDLNYFAVGVMAARYGNSTVLSSAEIVVWNFFQGVARTTASVVGSARNGWAGPPPSISYDFKQIYTGSKWAGYGYGSYEGRN